MEIYLEKDNRTIKKKFGGNVKGLLTELKINPEEFIVVSNNEVVLEETILRNTDKIKILSVISGG